MAVSYKKLWKLLIDLDMKKSPSGQAAAADASPGQEGLFDHMFDHRQRRNTRKQWN